jgi:signal transduction histidine kinase
MTPEEQWIIQREKALAWLRVGFALVAILVIQFNPSRVARFPVLSHLSLYSFFLYALLVLYLITRNRPGSRSTGLITTGFDLLWITLIVLSTGGLRTPFFVYYFFPVITASSRYGIQGSLAVAFVGVLLYGSIRFFSSRVDPIPIDLFLVRSVYLLVLASIFGFIADFEKKQGRKLMALSKSASELAVQEERRRIGQELHDRLLQTLASLTLRLEASRKHLIQSPEALSLELQLMEETARDAMQEIRGFLAGKDGLNLIPGTLVEKLKEEMRFLRDRLGFTALLESEPEELNLPQELEWEVYLVLRESLMNVVRHSQASEIALSLKQTHRDLLGSLKDNGVGFDFAKTLNGEGYGLPGIRERIQKLAGRLDVKTAPGKGTEISFVVPLPAITP